jgi:hypothetical protein
MRRFSEQFNKTKEIGSKYFFIMTFSCFNLTQATLNAEMTTEKTEILKD